MLNWYTCVCLYPPLRVVVHSKVNHSDYCTLSLRGMTRLREGKEAEFVELEQWIRDHNHFHQLLRTKTFATFRMWKAFSTWRKTVRSRWAWQPAHITPNQPGNNTSMILTLVIVAL